jgi:hypothetical protein
MFARGKSLLSRYVDRLLLYLRELLIPNYESTLVLTFFIKTAIVLLLFPRFRVKLGSKGRQIPRHSAPQNALRRPARTRSAKWPP